MISSAVVGTAANVLLDALAEIESTATAAVIREAVGVIADVLATGMVPELHCPLVKHPCAGQGWS